MNAVIAEKIRMAEEDRMARIESDVAELKHEVKALNASLSDFKTEVAKEFGAVRVELESVKTCMERMRVWMLGTGISTVLGIAILVGLKLH